MTQLFNAAVGEANRYRILFWSLLIITMLVFPLIVGRTYYQHMAILVLIWVVLGTSWNLLGGFTGQVSFGHAAFFGTGAYVTAMIAHHWKLSMFSGFVVALPVVWAIALFIGWVCFRLRGPYFALSVLASSEILRIVATNWDSVTGGGEGMLVIPAFASKLIYYYIILGLALAAALVTMLLMKSRWGYYFLAIREDQEAAEAMGVDTQKYKIISLLISSTFAGLAGAFYMNYMGYIEPHIVFNIPDISIMMILVVMLGGVATIEGPIIGAGLYIFLSELFRRFIGDGHLIVFGTLVIVIVIFTPNGLMGAFDSLGAWLKRRATQGRALEEQRSIEGDAS